MLFKENLVYLDLHKTGSSFLVRLLNDEVCGPLRYFVKHQSAATREKRRGQVWVMSVRHPFPYYVSLWSYGAQSRRGLFAAFEPSVRDRLYDTSNPLAFGEWLEHLAEGKGLARRANGTFANHHAGNVARSAEFGLGLYSLRLLTLATASPAMPNPQSALTRVASSDVVRWYHEHNRLDEIIRLETLIDDIRRVFARAELTVREGALDRLESAQRRNESVHDDPLNYYDDHSQRLVRERDRALFELFYP